MKSLRSRKKVISYYNYEINNITKDAQKAEFNIFINKNDFYHYENRHFQFSTFCGILDIWELPGILGILGIRGILEILGILGIPGILAI